MKPSLMEPEPKTPQGEVPKETTPAESAEVTLPPVGPFTEEQQQYLSGFIAGMNAGLLVLGKKPIMNHPDEKTGP
jgi:hypothetical protein